MRRCLVVDDSSVVRKVAKRILSSENFFVLEASSGHQGLALCRSDAFDLIVLDASLPDIATVEFITEIRALPAAAKPQIIVCLAELDVPTIMRAKRAGASGYILKPFDRPQLLKRMRQMNLAASTKESHVESHAFR